MTQQKAKQWVGWAAAGLLAVWAVGARGQPQPQELYQRARPAVVFIEAALSGTGFLVHPNGCILTAGHVVGTESQTEISVRLDDGRVLPAHVLALDNKNDVAVLKIDATDLPWLPLGDSDQVQIQDAVITIGFPGTLPTDAPTVTAGRVEAFRERTEYPLGGGRTAILENYFQISGTIRPGSSGGPVLDAQGRVVAIVATTPTSAQFSNTAFVSAINNAPLPASCAMARKAPFVVPMWLLAALGGLGALGLGAWAWRRFRPVDPLALLRQSTLFSELEDTQLQQVLEAATPQDFAMGEALVQEGDLDVGRMYLILQGQVEVRSGQRRHGKRGVGRTIGELALFTGEPRTADVVALKPTRCLEISKAGVFDLIRENPDIGLKMMADLLHRLNEADRALVAKRPV